MVNPGARCAAAKAPPSTNGETLENTLDPVVVSVVRHRLLAIVEEMGEAMLRTSYSQILNSSRDFSTAVCDLGGRLIAQAEHVPIHVGALPYAAQAVSWVRGATRSESAQTFQAASPLSGISFRRGRAAAPRPRATAGRVPANGGIEFGSLEVTEVRFPLFFRRHEFRPDSGGAGQYRGGPGGVVEMVVETAEPATANTAGDGVRHGACGILGGKDGLPHRYTLYSGDAPPRPIKTKETGITIRPGDVLILESGGGGGWGEPTRRGPAAIAIDLENGFVTAPSAEESG